MGLDYNPITKHYCHRQGNAPKTPELIISHGILEPLKQELLASRNVVFSSQIHGSKLQRVFALCDECWLSITSKNSAIVIISYASWGPAFWLFLRRSARALTIKAVRGIAAIKSIFDN